MFLIKEGGGGRNKYKPGGSCGAGNAARNTSSTSNTSRTSNSNSYTSRRKSGKMGAILLLSTAYNCRWTLCTFFRAPNLLENKCSLWDFSGPATITTPVLMIG